LLASYFKALSSSSFSLAWAALDRYTDLSLPTTHPTSLSILADTAITTKMVKRKSTDAELAEVDVRFKKAMRVKKDNGMFSCHLFPFPVALDMDCRPKWWGEEA